jgi:serine/threonine protein kinase
VNKPGPVGPPPPRSHGPSLPPPPGMSAPVVPSPPGAPVETPFSVGVRPGDSTSAQLQPIVAASPTATIGVGAKTGTHIVRSRAYSFVLDEHGRPIELGSGRSGKAYLGEEHWLESKTAFRRRVAIKILQKNTSPEDALRFQMEKEVLERVQGHPNIITLYASGESDNLEFIPAPIRDKVENDFMVLELCDMSLEERLKGSRGGEREDLLAYSPRDRLFRVLEYMMPIAAAVEFAHLECNVCHRDIKPGNILLRLPNPKLNGATLDVRLADMNVGKIRDEAQDLSVTRIHGVPGTLFFQAPEQETNAFEILVNVQSGSKEVTYFEDFYISIAQNDTFELFNRGKRYTVAGADLSKRKLMLTKPYEEPTENNVRAKIVKSVDRPADIYSLGAMLYYLISGTHGNPKTLYDAFYKFIEYDGRGDDNTIDAYVEHEYSVIQSIRAPKSEGQGQPNLAPADRFFSYKHYLDGNGELIDKEVLKIVGKAMIRNKPDSYCQAWDLHTQGISELIEDLRRLYSAMGAYMPSRPLHAIQAAKTSSRTKPQRAGLLGLWDQLVEIVRGRDRAADDQRGQPRARGALPPGSASRNGGPHGHG